MPDASFPFWRDGGSGNLRDGVQGPRPGFSEMLSETRPCAGVPFPGLPQTTEIAVSRHAEAVYAERNEAHA